MLSYKSEYKQPKFDSFLYKFSLDYPGYAMIVGVIYFLVFVFLIAEYMPNFFIGFSCLFLVEILLAVGHPVISHYVKYYKHIVEYIFDEEEIKVVEDNGKNSYSIKYNDIVDITLKWMDNRKVGQGYYLIITMHKRTHINPIDVLLSENKSEVIKLLEEKVGFRIDTQNVYNY